MPLKSMETCQVDNVLFASKYQAKKLNLILKMPFTTLVVFSASVDKDKAAQNVQPDY